MIRIILLAAVFLPIFLPGQQAIIIDHNCIDLDLIPDEYINSAKTSLWIGYGGTSHSTQLTAGGMEAIEQYFSDGTYDWGSTQSPDQVHVDEGGNGYLEGDLGSPNWDEETREYLDDHPGCNVIIWSWCGQVNSVDLSTHYLGPMEQLEAEYPDVKFVYMTGHLEGLGPDGSLFQANQQIRDYCNANNKILYDFADIEKYDPDAEVNFQEYFANDACDYQAPGGGTANWATDWLNANPGSELTQISELVSFCAHSVSLNCTKKGIAAWYLWARLAGWEGPASISEKKNQLINIKIYPNPAREDINICFTETVYCETLEIRDMRGRSLYSKLVNENREELHITDINLPTGVYIISLVSGRQVFTGKFAYNN